MIKRHLHLNKTHIRYTHIQADIVIILLFIVVFIFSFAFAPDNYVYKPLSSSNYVDFNDNWTDLNGDFASLTDINKLPKNSYGRVVISGRLPYYLTSNQCLNFRSKNIDFDIYVDDEPIYTFHPSVGKMAGNSYGSCFHSVVLGPKYSHCLIKIILFPAYDDNNCFLDNMLIEPAGNYCWQFFVSHIFSTVICIITILFGILGLLFSSIFRKNGIHNPSINYLSIMAIGMGFWCLFETLTLQMLTGSLTVIHALNYFLLIAIPYPSIMFINYSLSKPNIRYTRAAVGGVVTCSIICYSLNFLGIYDMHECLPVIHLFILFAFLYICYMIGKDYIRHKNSIKFSSTRMILIAFLIFTICTFIDLLRYWTSDKGVSDSALFMRIGLFLFIVLVTVDSFMQILSQFKMAKQADMMREIASTDSLTGIPNRFAYNTLESDLAHQISQNEVSSILVCSMDINNLKLINDIYGHSYGDKHIMAAAAIITDAFSDYGSCFRTGGDEFMLLMKIDEPEPIFNECIDEMIRAESEYNDMTDVSIPLVIAYGYAVYSKNCQCTLEQIIQQADRNMYKCKRAFKHQL